jgi:hypothetical protein
MAASLTCSGAGGLPAALDAAIEDSAARAGGAWPVRGRPDPVRTGCMLGGQLVLDVASRPLPAPAGTPACTCHCAAPLAWGAGVGSRQGQRAQLLVLGYADGTIQLTFDDDESGAALPLHASLRRAPTAAAA